MNLKKLATRTISGVVYCLIIIGLILWGETGVMILGGLLAALACIEFAKISHELPPNRIPVIILDVAGCVMLCLSYHGFPLVVWLAIMVARLVEQLYVKSETPLRDLAHSMMSQIYIGLPLGIMVGLSYSYSPALILLLFILIWINDTGAFLTGSLVGRHKLFERISPKKTWEGFIGGFILSTGAAALLYFIGLRYYDCFSGMRDYEIGIWAGLGATVSIFATWGDLIESMIKRNLKIKDSGNIIPGHGGILDRIDSLLLVLPAALVYLFMITAK